MSAFVMSSSVTCVAFVFSAMTLLSGIRVTVYVSEEWSTKPSCVPSSSMSQLRVTFWFVSLVSLRFLGALGVSCPTKVVAFVSAPLPSRSLVV